MLEGKASRRSQKWRGPDENIRANLRQYGLEKHYLDVLVSDASKPIWRKRVQFDVIITDRKLIHSLKYVCLIKIVSSNYGDEEGENFYELVFLFPIL